MSPATSQFLAPPNPVIICGLCDQVFSDPWTVCVEEHVFCFKCYQSDERRLTATGAKFDCGVCQSFTHYIPRPAKDIMRSIKTSSCSCFHRVSGCTWIGPAGELQSHAKECGFQIVLCPNSPAGCKEHVLKSQARKHCQEGDCRYQLMACPRGGLNCTYLRKDKASHPNFCNFWSCPEDNCEVVDTFDFITAHQPTCKKLRSELAEALGEVAMLKHTNFQLETQRRDAVDKVEEVEGELADFEETYEDLFHELNEMEKDRDSLRVKVAEVEEKLAIATKGPGDLYLDLLKFKEESERKSKLVKLLEDENAELRRAARDLKLGEKVVEETIDTPVGGVGLKRTLSEMSGKSRLSMEATEMAEEAEEEEHDEDVPSKRQKSVDLF